MGIIKKIFGSKPEPQVRELVEKVSRTTSADFLGRDGVQGEAPRADIKTLVSTAEANVWIYACLWTITNAPTQVPYYFTSDPERDSKPLSDADSKELNRWLFAPNDYMSREDLFVRIMMDLELAGDVYIEWVDDDVKEAHVLLAPRVKIVPSRLHRIEAYRYHANGKDIDFNADEIIHAQWPNPNDDLYGLAPAKSVEPELINEFLASAHIKHFLQNHARHELAFSADDMLGQDEFDRLKKEINEKYHSPKNAGKPVLLEGGMEVKILDMSPKDMEFKEMRKWDRESILSAMGVPPVMVGVFEYANYANSREQKEIFWEDTMPPKLRKLESVMSRVLQRIFDKDVYMHFKEDEVPALKRARLEQAEAIGKFVRDGIITRNEAREKIGMEPSKAKGMDKHSIQIGNDFIEDLADITEFSEVPPLEFEQESAVNDARPTREQRQSEITAERAQSQANSQ